MQSRRELLTWNDVDKLIDHLLPQFEQEFEAMVMITRGGIVPGGLLAEALHITHLLTAAVDFPAEIDAEIKAKEMAISLLGLESYHAFVSNEILHNNATDYYKKLQILEISRPSYKEATLLLICSSKDAFIDQQKRLNKKGNNFDFDIERLCVSY